VVLWAARVQIPHPAPPNVPREIRILQSFLEKLEILLVFQSLVLSGLPFIHILDLNGRFDENISGEAIFEVT